jgi:TatA/E family protein of Tat protein translocase
MTALIMGTAGAGELLVLFVVILILFGPAQLPAMARAIGRILNQLRRASQDFSDQIMRMDVEERPAPPLRLPSATDSAGDDPAAQDSAVTDEKGPGHDAIAG